MPCGRERWRFAGGLGRRLGNPPSFKKILRTLHQAKGTGIRTARDQLEKMRDYISASGSVDRGHLEADNVLGPIYRAFGERLWPLMEELNLTLAA